MKKHPKLTRLILTAALMLAFTCGLTATTNRPNFADANPYTHALYSGPTDDTFPALTPKITILSPQQNHPANTNNLSFTFNLTSPTGVAANGLTMPTIHEIYYFLDKQKETTIIYHKPTMDEYTKGNRTLYFNGTYYETKQGPYGMPLGMPYFNETVTVPLTGLSEGKHSLTLVVTGAGEYYKTVMAWYEYYANTSARIEFSVDMSSPLISVDSPGNQTYAISEAVPLNYTVSEQGLKIVYSLDGMQNMTLTGNTQLYNLTAGTHSVKLYAEDLAGNVGLDTMDFDVEEPNVLSDFNLVIIFAVGVAAVIAGVGVFAYHRKHRHR